MSFKFLRRNLALKIFSLLLAIGLWAYVKYISTPKALMASETSFDVPLVAENLEEKLIPLDMPKRVKVTVKGSSGTLSQLKRSHFKAYINFSGKKNGVYKLPVKVETPPDVTLVKVDPDKVELCIDSLEKRLFPVKVKSTGTVASGFILGKMEAQPEGVTVIGPQSLLSKVKEVQAVCDVDGADMDLVQRVDVEIVDEDGKVIEGLKAEPNYVRASVQVKNEIVNTTVPVVPYIQGTPAKGYHIERIIVTPPSATIQYRYNLSKPPNSIQTQPISVEGVKSSIAQDVSLTVPQDVSLVSPERVKIHIMVVRNKEKGVLRD